MRVQILPTFLAGLSLLAATPAFAATRGADLTVREQPAKLPTVELANHSLAVRDIGELSAAWKTVSLFAEGRPLYTHHEGGPFGEFWSANPTFAPVKSQVADFLRFNQHSSLTPYEASALGRALSALPGTPTTMWAANGQVHTLDGAYTVGDRVNFASRAAGQTTGIVIAVDGNRLQVLTADVNGTPRNYEVDRAEIARKVTSALIDRAPLAR